MTWALRVTASCCSSCSITSLQAQLFLRRSFNSRISLGVNPMRAVILVTHVRHVFVSHRVLTSVLTSRTELVRCCPSCSQRSSGSTSKSGLKAPKLSTYVGSLAGLQGFVNLMVGDLHSWFPVRLSASTGGASTSANANVTAAGQVVRCKVRFLCMILPSYLPGTFTSYAVTS